MFAFITKIENFFSSPSVKAAEQAFVEDAGPVTTGLFELLSILGVQVSAHATAIIKDVVVASTTSLSASDKASAVANGVRQIARDTGSASLANNADAIVKTAFLIAKTEGLLGAPVPVAAPVATPPTNVAVAYQNPIAAVLPVPAPQPGSVVAAVTGIPRDPV